MDGFRLFAATQAPRSSGGFCLKRPHARWHYPAMMCPGELDPSDLRRPPGRACRDQRRYSLTRLAKFGDKHIAHICVESTWELNMPGNFGSTVKTVTIPADMKLTSDSFVTNSDGSVVIKDASLAKILKDSLPVAVNDQSTQAVKVSVGVDF